MGVLQQLRTAGVILHRLSKASLTCLRRWSLTIIPPLLLVSFRGVDLSQAGPVTLDQARRAAEAVVIRRYPARDAHRLRTQSSAGSSELGVERVWPLSSAGKTVGYVCELAPAGYVLMRADDQAPPVKLHSDVGAFTRLPPRLVEVFQRELAEELSFVEASQEGKPPRRSTYQVEWAALLNPTKASLKARPLATPQAGVILLETTWDQGWPYNYRCPVTSGWPGMGEHSPVGCVATALAQILRYHQQPNVVHRDYGYVDDDGSYMGPHAISDAGLAPYGWDLMPPALSESSSPEEIEAVARLLFHSAVAVESDFEDSATSVGGNQLGGPLFRQFGYLSTDLESRAGYTTSQWFDKIVTEIDASRPIYYSLNDGGPTAHALVCDGYEGGNQIHLNMGWAGAFNAWYSLDTAVEVFPYSWTQHDAVFGITPPGASALPAPVLKPEPATTKGPRNTIAWSSLTGGLPSVPATASFSPLPATGSAVNLVSEPAGLGGDTTLMPASAGGLLPNLAPYQPPGWSDALVVSTRLGTIKSEILHDDDELEYDWAIINNGSGAVLDGFGIAIYVDQTLRVTYSGGYSEPNQWGYSTRCFLGRLSAGTHTITIRADSASQIEEANESDNEYTKTFAVLSAGGVEYLAEAADNAQFLLPQSSGWISALEYTFSNLTPGVTYWYRVKARRGPAEGVWSTFEHSEQELTGTIVLSGDLAFGKVQTHRYATRTLTIANAGEAPFTVTGISYPAGFDAGTAWTGDMEIAAGSSQAVLVHFGPAVAGSHGGMLNVSSDATAGSSSIAVSGLGCTGYYLWAIGSFGEAEVADLLKEATLWGPDADPDGDGRANLLEYALQCDPTIPDLDTLEISVVGQNLDRLRLKIKHRVDWDLDYIIEVSGDCGEWQSGYGYVWMVHPPWFEWLEAEDLLPASPGNPRFIRLRVVQH